MLLKILFLLCMLPNDARWQRVDTEQYISFLFPNAVQKLHNHRDGVSSTIYQTKNLTCVFGVICSDFSGKQSVVSRENALQLYEELKKGSLEMETAILKDERTVPYNNMLIKEIEYSIIKDKYEMTYFKRFIFRDNYIYQISIGGRARHRDIIQAEREVFFNSIYFMEPSDTKQE